MKKFTGNDIREVWNFRLSQGSPILYQDGEKWVVKIWANNPGAEEYSDMPGYGVKVLLAEHQTDVSTTGNPHDPAGVTACYEWLMSVRDDFQRPHFELRKPLVALIEKSNGYMCKLMGDVQIAKDNDDTAMFHQLTGEASEYLRSANMLIATATAEFHLRVADLGGAS